DLLRWHGVEPRALDDPARAVNRHGLLGPDLSIRVHPLQHGRLHPEAFAGDQHDVAAELHVARVLNEIALVARDFPLAPRLLDPDRYLSEKGLAGSGERFGALGVEAPSIAAALGIFLNVDFPDLLVGLRGHEFLLSRGRSAVSLDDQDADHDRHE